MTSFLFKKCGGGIGRRRVGGRMATCGGVRVPECPGSIPGRAGCKNIAMQGANPCPRIPV